MATVPYSTAGSATESATEAGLFRPSAAYPLPRLRPVADFVVLPTGKRYVTVQGKFGIAMGATVAEKQKWYHAAPSRLPRPVPRIQTQTKSATCDSPS